MPDPKSIYLGDLHWRDLTPEQVAHFYQEYKSLIVTHHDAAFKSAVELNKYLLTIHSGAAAGVFYLLNNGAGGSWLLASFYVFCLGVFFVGASHFLITTWLTDRTNLIGKNLNAWGRNEMTMRQMDASHSRQFGSIKRRVARASVAISFALLVVGGVLAVVPFSKGRAVPPQAPVPMERASGR